MHCYIINMPKCKERLERTKREISKYCPGLTWSIPLMFLGEKMSDAYISSVYDSRGAWELYNRDLSRGEIACALSHQSALKEFLKGNDSSCLIVEDDVLFSPIIGVFLDGLYKWLLKHKATPICTVLSEAEAVRYWTACPWIHEFQRTRPIKIYGAIAYVVNRAGAEMILKINSWPIKVTSDYWSFYRKHGLKVFGVDKLLAGSFDFSRKDSALDSGRVEIYKKSLEKRDSIPFRHRVWLSCLARARYLWWYLSGVTIIDERTNSRIYKILEREK